MTVIRVIRIPVLLAVTIGIAFGTSSGLNGEDAIPTTPKGTFLVTEGAVMEEMDDIHGMSMVSQASNFTIMKKSLTFTGAMQECIKANGFLADIKDVMEKDALVRLAKKEIPSYGYGLRVGMAPLGRAGRPVWLTSGKPIPNQLWSSGRPATTANCTKTCGSLGWRKAPTGLHLINCADPHYFVCKFS